MSCLSLCMECSSLCSLYTETPMRSTRTLIIYFVSAKRSTFFLFLRHLLQRGSPLRPYLLLPKITILWVLIGPWDDWIWLGSSTGGLLKSINRLGCGRVPREGKWLSSPMTGEGIRSISVDDRRESEAVIWRFLWSERGSIKDSKEPGVRSTATSKSIEVCI